MRQLGRGGVVGALGWLLLLGTTAGAFAAGQQGSAADSAQAADGAQHAAPGQQPPPDKAKAAGGKQPADGAGQPAGQPAQQAPAKPSTATDNPFPEEESQAAQKAATEEDRADRKAADAGSAVRPEGGADGAAGSSSRDKLAGMDVLGERDSRIANGAGGTIVDPKLAAKDLAVGRQYYALGDFAGAYARFKEAVTVNPGNLDAVFYLAEAARKTAHLDESAENYRVYLEAQPDGGKAKAARKALEQLAGK